MNELPIEPRETPIIGPGYTYASVTDKISSIVLTKKTPTGWLIGFGISFIHDDAPVCRDHLLVKGSGSGNQYPVAWASPSSFVWWIGIGRAGTLISAILLLLRQDWRTSINRFAEAMTLFAVSVPDYIRSYILVAHGLHTGSFHIRRRWICGRISQSPRLGRVRRFDLRDGVSSVFGVGLIRTWTLRDRSSSRYGRILWNLRDGMAWLGDSLASMRGGVSVRGARDAARRVGAHGGGFDFAISILPGWHTTIFPPYFRGRRSIRDSRW